MERPTPYKRDEYVYTDPVEDSAWPRITEHNGSNDTFPAGWGNRFTVRDIAGVVNK